MNRHHTVTLGALSAIAAAFFMAGVASAQTVPSSTVVSSTVTQGTTTPGASGATVATIELRSLQPGSLQITSLPLNLTTTGGATASSLSGCQLYNASGTALSTGNNISNSIQSGSNTFTLDTPLSVSQGSPVTLSLRCNVASGSPSSGVFQFASVTPNLAPSLGVTVMTGNNVPRNGSNIILGFLNLDATRSGSNVNVTSIPLTATLGNGLTTANLSNCALRNVTNIGTALNTGTNAITNFGSGTATFRTDTTLSVPAGGVLSLALTCNVTNAPVGGSVLLSVNPAQVTATGGTNNAAVTPAAGLTSTGATGLTSGTVTFADTTSTPTTPTTPTTPGVPNTGTGADMLMLITLLASVLALGIGTSTLMSRRS